MVELKVETAGEAGGVCECCGNETRTVWGYVHSGDHTVAAYFVQWTRGKSDHAPNFDLLIGTWGNPEVKDKKLASWVFNPDQAGGSFMAVDGSNRPVARSELCSIVLTREQIIGDAELKDLCTSLIDAVWLGDSRIKEVTGFTRAS
jgi:hypothetical protein